MAQQIQAGQYRLEIDGRQLVVRDPLGHVVETVDDVGTVAEIRLPDGTTVSMAALADAFADPSVTEIETAAGGTDPAGNGDAQDSGGLGLTLFGERSGIGGLAAVGGQRGTTLSYGDEPFTDGQALYKVSQVAAAEAPTYAPIAEVLDVATDEDDGVTGAVKATDRDGDPLGFAVVEGPAHGTLQFEADGAFTYKPDPNYNGPDGFTYRANDGSQDSNLAAVNITVTPVNDAPVAADGAFAGDEDTAISAAAKAADVEGDALTYAIVDGPQHGELKLNADGSFVYKPDADYSGADSFTYRANDGELDSNTAKIEITVSAVNDAPTADAAALTVDEDTAFFGAAVAADPEGDKLGYAVVEGPQHGELKFNADGSFVYKPEADYSGADSFTYRANDGGADSNTAKIDITVASVNDAPIADDGAVATGEDSPVSGQAAATDIDSPALSYSIVDGPQHGSVLFNTDGSFTYTPDADYAGADSFTYRANDGGLNSNAAKVDITVKAINDAPVVTATDGNVITEIVSHTANLIVNGSFEDLGGKGLSGTGWAVYQNLPGWHTGRTDNAKAAGIEVQHGSVIKAADGGNYIELDSDSFEGKAPTTTNATIYQDVKSAEGESYVLSFAYSPRVTTAGTHTNDVEVWWGGQKITTLTGNKQGWTTYTFEVEGAAGKSRLEFIGTGAADRLGGFIDNVSLHAGPSVDTAMQLHPTVHLSDIDSAMLSKVTVETAGFQIGDHLEPPASSLFTVATLQHGNDVSLEIVAKSGAAGVGDFQAFLDGLNFSTKSEAAGDRSITYTAVDDQGLASSPAVAHIAVASSYDVNASDLNAAHATQLGAGDDTLHLDQTMSSNLDLGSGYDVVKLEQTNMAFGHNEAAKLHNIEEIDAGGYGKNAVTLSVDDVLGMSDGNNHLTVVGNSGDSLKLVGDGANQWQVTDSDASFTTVAFDNGFFQAVIVVSNELSLTVN